MLPDALAALRQAAEAVRRQIPAGELTLASVEQLLRAADAAVAAAAAGSLPARAAPLASPRASKRQEARQRWARIAQENAQEEARHAPAAAE